MKSDERENITFLHIAGPTSKLVTKMTKKVVVGKDNAF
jgi:hypothetical protein